MKQIYFATTNLGKVDTLTSVLSQHGIKVVHENIELPEPRSEKLYEIAAQKVRAAYDKIRKPVIAQDSGFYIHSLNDFPGPFVHLLLKLSLEKILKIIEGEPRECEFRNCLAYYDGRVERPVIFESNIAGSLSDSPKGKLRGNEWSPLFLIFIPNCETKTLAEMTPEEHEIFRSKIHRDSYLAKFAQWFIRRDDDATNILEKFEQ